MYLWPRRRVAASYSSQTTSPPNREFSSPALRAVLEAACSTKARPPRLRSSNRLALRTPARLSQPSCAPWPPLFHPTVALTLPPTLSQPARSVSRAGNTRRSQSTETRARLDAFQRPPPRPARARAPRLVPPRARAKTAPLSRTAPTRRESVVVPRSVFRLYASHRFSIDSTSVSPVVDF